ncbi:MAG: NAD(P)H-dependent oxidoreductase [Kiritimatiellae bacterium]|nr:NAD(P)H-dependent oxidoreductase [Kiritimatiellia bacterium]MCO5060676.1 NAD(P)H-dependent oxidoreductase [Kiritimatiellia bacterium]MCO6401185.1 NAD(P)H-dependent oxidoreductase [Verrucomicrobiota bacterium]
MNVLHVIANPRPIEESVSKQLAAAFFARLLEKNPDVTVNNIDLYQEAPPYLSLDAYRRIYNPVYNPEYTPTKAEENAINYAKAQAENLRQADILVLTMPMWAGGPPAIMKAWIDQVIQPGLIYDIENGLVVPQHQLRKVILLVSSGDVYKEGDDRDGIMPIINNIFGRIGVTEIEVAWADGQDPNLHSDGDDRKQSAIEMTEELADDAAESP